MDAIRTTGSTTHIGWIVAGSLAIGLVVGLILVAAPFIPADEGRVTGALLCGFALGWASLAFLSVRFGDQPQTWAAAPALLMGLGGLALVSFGSSAHGVLQWVWPPTLLLVAIWVVVQSRRMLDSRSGRLMLYPVFAMLFLTSVGGVYQAVSQAIGPSAYPMPGQLIDVGGHGLHLACTGSGSPTVVLEAGGGDTSSAFGWVAPAVAHETRVCVYDRAGRGWSEPATTRQDAIQVSTDLHVLLSRGHVPGPYVLAGHSFGGLYVLTFSALYPDDVVGMVLVDSTAPASVATALGTSDGNEGPDVSSRFSALASASARLGLGRLVALTDYATLPSQSRDEIRASVATASHIQSTIDEYLQANASSGEAAALTDFANKPLIVLTAGVGSNAVWMSAQDHLATLSGNSAHRVINGAVHAALIHDEQYAAATTVAILDVLTAIREGEPVR